MADAQTGKDIYEVLDTAVKIGLGALIGGVFSYITLKANHKNEAEKEKRAYKLKTLDEASIVLEDYFNTAENYLNLFYGFSCKENIKASKLKESEINEFRIMEEEFSKKEYNMKKAVSKFNIINIEGIDKQTIVLSSKIWKIRNHVLVEKKTFPEKEKILAILNHIDNIRNEFQSKINKYFESLE